MVQEGFETGSGNVIVVTLPPGSFTVIESAIVATR
jgi:hypothetical protein